jgi:hypothetical protein
MGSHESAGTDSSMMDGLSWPGGSFMSIWWGLSRKKRLFSTVATGAIVWLQSTWKQARKRAFFMGEHGKPNGRKRGIMFQPLKSLLLGIIVGLAFTRTGHAYTVVTASSAAPAGIELAFIAATTTQFNATVIPNPFFPGTYSVTLYGPNPSYNPPLTSAQLLQQIDLNEQYITTVDSYTYPMGWADGESYQKYMDVNAATQITGACWNPLAWGGVQIDTTTCVTVGNTLSSTIYQENLSTPTVVPGNWQ